MGSLNNEMNKKETPDFYTLKGVIENLFDIFLGLEKGLYIRLKKILKIINLCTPLKRPQLNFLGKKCHYIGYFWKLHPILADKMKLNQDLFVLNLI